MFKRRSTLGPVQKQKKTKQTQYYAILQTCMQIPNDDKLIVRKLILSQQDLLIDLFQKFKKNKNLRQLQILLRKYIQNYKNNQHSSLVNLYKSTSKQNTLLNQQKSIKKMTTLSSLHGSIAQSPNKQKKISNNKLTRNNTKKTLEALDQLEWQRRIQNQIQKQIMTNMNQKQLQMQMQNYQIQYMQDDNSIILCQQDKNKINQQQRPNFNPPLSFKNEIIIQSIKKKQKQIKNYQKEIAQISININWQNKSKEQQKTIGTIGQMVQKVQQTQQNNQQLEITLKQINFSKNSNICNIDALQKKSYSKTKTQNYSPQVRLSDCYSSQIKQFRQNLGVPKGQSTLRSSIRTSLNFQPSINVDQTRRNTLADKQNLIRRELFGTIDDLKLRQKEANQFNYRQFTKNRKTSLQNSKQHSLQSTSEQKCKIANSTATYRPQVNMRMQNFQQSTCLTSKKKISTDKRLFNYENKFNENRSIQQKYIDAIKMGKSFTDHESRTNFYNRSPYSATSNYNFQNICDSRKNESAVHKSGIKANSKNKQMQFYKRIQMTINGQMD